LIWLVVTVFGLASYTTFLRREGFPSINIPLAFVGGTYFVNDPAKVDTEVAKPISDIALERDDVSAVQTQSGSNFFSVAVQFKEGADGKKSAGELEAAVKQANVLPSQAQATYNVPYFGATGGDVEQIDLAVSFYDKDNQTPVEELAAKAEAAAAWLNDKNLSYVKEAFVKNPFENVTNPATGEAVTVQRSFDRYGERTGDDTEYHQSVIIGIAAVEGFDLIKFDEQVHEALIEL